MADIDLLDNNALNNNFQVVINSMKGVSFKSTRVVIPGFSFQSSAVDAPMQELHFPGMKFYTDPVLFTFIVDEKWTNWFEVTKWMFKARNVDLDSQEKILEILQDFTVNITDNVGKPNLALRFKLAFPQSIDGTELVSNSGRADPLTATVAMRFNGIEIDQYKGDNVSETIELINSNGNYGG